MSAGRDYNRPSRALPSLANSRGSAGGRARAGRQQEPDGGAPPPPRPPLRLTVVRQGYMVPTNGTTKETYAGGDRDDTCARYSACLDAHLAAHQGRTQGGPETPASCRKTDVLEDGSLGCRWREPAERPRATEYMRSRDG